MARKRVLVVDDEPDIREVARVSLEMVGGWEVFTAPSGREGLALAASTKPDVILLDVRFTSAFAVGGHCAVR